MRAHGTLRAHRELWCFALRALWERRGTILLVAVLVWVPWRIFVPRIDEAFAFSERFGFGIDLVADAFLESYFAGVVLAILSAKDVTSRTALSRGLWLLPRFLLIDLKIAAIGLAVPLLTLYLGTATVLTVWHRQAAGALVVAVTLLGLLWTVYVMVRYLLAHAVLVSEGANDGWRSETVSTGWSMWAGRALLRDNWRQALLVVIVGQTAMTLALAVVPQGEHVVTRVFGGLMMGLTAVWWSLVWQFCRSCVESREAARATRTS